jgi:repressor LexA
MNTTIIDLLPPTSRQAEVLAFIRANSHLYGPSIREIARHIGANNVNGVVGHLKALERKGLIRRRPGVTRGIEVICD